MKKLLIVLLAASLFSCEKETKPEPPKTVEEPKETHKILTTNHAIGYKDWQKKGTNTYNHFIDFTGDSLISVTGKTDYDLEFEFPSPEVYPGYTFDSKFHYPDRIEIIAKLSGNAKPNTKGLYIKVTGSYKNQSI